MRMVVFADPQMEGDAKIRRLGKRGKLSFFSLLVVEGREKGGGRERTDQATPLLFFFLFLPLDWRWNNDIVDPLLALPHTTLSLG